MTLVILNLSSKYYSFRMLTLPPNRIDQCNVFIWDSEASDCGERSEPQSENLADIYWNCLLYICLCQYQIHVPSTIPLEQLSYIYRWNILEFRYSYM